MNFDEALAMVESHSDYRVIHRLRLADDQVFNEPSGAEPRLRLAVIDTETTGLDPISGDRIIDLAIANCEYGKDTGTLYRVVTRYESLEDPGFPIDPAITHLTGISDEMVKGRKIDEAALAQAMEGVSLVVCHNALFDRAFLESRNPAFSALPFACSLKEIPWKLWGTSSSKLDYLGFRFKLFNNAHRARSDVDMLLALLTQKVPEQEDTALSLLLASARNPLWHIHASGLPFEQKDTVKARGYSWYSGGNGLDKAWWIQVQNLELELKFLEEAGCRNPQVMKLTAKERYRPFAELALSDHLVTISKR